MAELVKNCRDVHEIARLVRRHLDDARAPMIGPSALGVDRQPADDLRAVIGAVNARLVDRLEPMSAIHEHRGGHLHHLRPDAT